MNKAELISAMAAESGLSKTDSKKALDAFIASVTKAMKAGDKSIIGWFLELSVWWKEERVWVSTPLLKSLSRLLQRKLLNSNQVRN